MADSKSDTDNERTQQAVERLNLRSLSPTYQDDQHGSHVELLIASIGEKGESAPRNIAITGHYGSGKSSVISEIERRLKNCKVQVVNLSLPSLGIGNGRLTDGAEPRDKTNLIQKEIVKQLLYRKPPHAVPASRFRRLDVFRPGPVIGWTVVTVLLAGILGLLFDVPSVLGATLPAKYVADMPWLPWVGLVALMALVGAVFVGVSTCLRTLPSIKKFSAGPATVELSDDNNSYFDEYLDEIIYFFQTSKTSIAIFEDLDRFKDPHIFETLRELNTLLNSAEQLKVRPVRFVYALRDSIFEELGVDATADEPALGSATAKGTEVRHLTSTNRTKFFDLVLPMVPFISHRTSRDLIRKELQGLPDEFRPSDAIGDLVGAHLTDMRLIKNICNEYEIFAHRVLPPQGLQALDADHLFAMMIYKNLFLRDFERIREGTSFLDDVYHQYRALVTEQAKRAREQEAGAQAQLERLDDIVPRSKRYGERLREALEATVPPRQFDASRVQVEVGRSKFTFDQLNGSEFWRALFAAKTLTFIPGVPRYGNVTYQLQQVKGLMGEHLSLADWTEDDRADLEEEVRLASELRKVVTNASMEKVFSREDFIVSYEGEDLTLIQVAAKVLGEANLSLELLRCGYIDENFTLYVADFHGVSVSAVAMNFILHAVQPNKMDIQYRFGTPEDIYAIVQEEAGRLFSGRSVYNIEIFDWLLDTNPKQLELPLSRLAAGASSDTEFIDAYVASGEKVVEFIGLLSGRWPGVFRYLIGLKDAIDEEVRGNLLSAALAGARPSVDYTVGSAERDAIKRRFAELVVFRKPMSTSASARLAELLQRFGISIEDLSQVAQPLCAELVKQQIFPVTHTNLVTVLGAESSLSLDAIKIADENVLYLHVLERLDEYLNVVTQAALQSVSDEDSFVEVLTDVAETAPDFLEEVARKAASDCIVSDLSSIEATMWPALARAQRFSSTMANVDAYLGEHGVDEAIAVRLGRSGEITDLDEDQDARLSLAVTLVNSLTTNEDVKVGLLQSLELGRPIDPYQIEDRAVSIIPALVDANLVDDDATAFERLSGSEWEVKKHLVKVSNQFTSYLSELDLLPEDISGIATGGGAPAPAVDWLLENVADFENTLDKPTAAALARHAVKRATSLSCEAVTVLAAAGAEKGSILKLVGVGVAEWGLEQIEPILRALGEPYSGLLEPGRYRPKIPLLPGVEELLMRLKQVGSVSSYSEKTSKSEIRVNMRHE